jgi:hypothetical protein
MDKEVTNDESAFDLLPVKDAEQEADPFVHKLGKGIVCKTDTRGSATPRKLGPFELVVDSTDGFIPLWDKGVTLRWRFNPKSMSQFKNPAAARLAIRKLFGEAVSAWGDSAPVKFLERNNAWDFEIVVSPSDECSAAGCVLAMAFFPDAGRHQLMVYPKMFQQVHTEQVETIIHEIGHIFGLRHFFANISEKRWSSEIFGAHQVFTIMNYGSNSVLTTEDKADLKKLYELAWSGELTKINGTSIKLLKPFHALH